MYLTPIPRMREDFERTLAEKEEDITLRVEEIKEELRREEENKQKLHEAQLDAVKVQMEEELRVELEIKMKDASAHGYESAMAAAKGTYEKLADEHAQEKQALQELVSKLEEDLKDAQGTVAENEIVIQELKDAAVEQEEAIEAQIDEAVAAKVAQLERDGMLGRGGGAGAGGGGGGGGTELNQSIAGETGHATPRQGRRKPVGNGEEKNEVKKTEALSSRSVARKSSAKGGKFDAAEVETMQAELERTQDEYDAQLFETRSHLKTAQTQLYSQVQRFNKLKQQHQSLLQEHEQAKAQLEEADTLQAALHEQVLAAAASTSASAGDEDVSADPVDETENSTDQRSNMAVVSREQGDSSGGRGRGRRRSISFDLPAHKASTGSGEHGQGSGSRNGNGKSSGGGGAQHERSHPVHFVDHKQVEALKKKLGSVKMQRKHISTLNVALTKKCARMANRVSELEQLEMALKLDAQRKAKQFHDMQCKRKSLEEDLASAKKGIVVEKADRQAAVVKLALHYEELVKKWKGVSFRAMSGSAKKASEDAKIELEVEGHRGAGQDVAGRPVSRARGGGGGSRPRPFLPVKQQIDAMDHALRQSARVHANKE